MNIIEAAILGMIQGLTEFIPVSSSGHLVIAQHLMGLETSHIFDVMVNLGTFVALIVYFRKRIWDIGVRVVKKRDIRLIRNLAISAIPVGVLGWFFEDIFAHPMVQHPLTVASMLLLIGALMIVVERLPRFSSLNSGDELPALRAWAIGIAQAMALIPGVSRSGSTMIMGRLAGLTFRQAAEYSFLLSIPVMAAVVFKGFIGGEGQAFIAQHFAIWAVSNVVAFLCGLFAVGFMLRFLGKGNFSIFGYYRVGLAALIVLLVGFGVI